MKTMQHGYAINRADSRSLYRNHYIGILRRRWKGITSNREPISRYRYIPLLQLFWNKPADL